MRNNREIEGPKNKNKKEIKKKKKKNQGKGMWHIRKWEEVSSFLKYDLE